jgi:hypothetical protein
MRIGVVNGSDVTGVIGTASRLFVAGLQASAPTFLLFIASVACGLSPILK